MTKGWCPVHDRIVESRKGICPECGTPLVEVGARAREPEESRLVVEQEEPSPVEAPLEVPVASETKLWPQIRLPERFFGRGTISLGAPAIAAILAGAVVASFLVGLAIPRGGRRADPVTGAAPPVRRDVTVGTTKAGPGVDLRLESFSQRGSRVTLKITVPETARIEAGRIQSVEVAAVVEGMNVDAGSTVLLARTTISPTNVSGFVAEGDLSIPSGAAVTGLRIQSLNLSTKQGVEFPLDLSDLAPSSSGAGRVKVVRSRTRSAGFRDYQVSDIVAWPDRLEVRMYVSGELESWFVDEVYTLEQPIHAADEGSVLEGVTTGFLHVVFRTEPPYSKRSVLRVTVRGVSISGGWAWDLP